MFRRVLTRSLLPILIVACAGVVLLLGTLRYGLVQGDEFAPDTFQRRTYWYYELPLVRIKVTPVKRRVDRHQLERLLVAKQYITPNAPPKRWDLIEARRGGKAWRQGDAQILTLYLDAYDADKNWTSFWETWTTAHPTLAGVLWPEIAALARRDLYWMIPPLFEQAVGHDTAASLRGDLNLLLARNYDSLAVAEVELGNLNTAIRFYSQALRHQPGRVDSLRGRAACYDKLGDNDEAAEDRNAISRRAEQEPQ